MKKLICLILTLTLLMIAGSVSFAAENGTTLPTEQVPGAPNVETTTYDEPSVVIDEGTPGGGVDTSNKGGDSKEIKNEDVPKAPLPKTGGIPAEAFYVAGALIIAAALILSRKKTASSKN